MSHFSLNRIFDKHIEEFIRGLGGLHHLKSLDINLKLEIIEDFCFIEKRSSEMTENGIKKMKKNLKKLCSLKSIGLEIE